MKKLIRGISLLMVLGLYATGVNSATVDGDWNVSLTAAEGSTHFRMTVEVDGTNAKGHVGDAVFNGSFSDGKLSLAGEFYVMEAGYTSKLDMTVSMQGELLKGTATWDIYTADVLGKRPE